VSLKDKRMKKLINIRLIAIGWILGDSIIGIMEENYVKALFAAILVFFLLIDYSRHM